MNAKIRIFKALATKNGEAVLDYIYAHPECTIREITQEVKGVSVYRLSKILYLLFKAKLVKSVRPHQGDMRFRGYIVPNIKLYLQIKEICA